MTLSYMLNKLERGITSMNDYSLSSVGTFKHETLEEIKNAKKMILKIRSIKCS